MGPVGSDPLRRRTVAVNYDRRIECRIGLPPTAAPRTPDANGLMAGLPVAEPERVYARLERVSMGAGWCLAAVEV